MAELTNLRKHPLSGALYGVDDMGQVHVDDGESQGVFTSDGTWVRGELREADPHLCGWLAGPQLPEGWAVLPKDLPVEVHES
jgi:hypothetical protein